MLGPNNMWRPLKAQSFWDSSQHVKGDLLLEMCQNTSKRTNLFGVLVDSQHFKYIKALSSTLETKIMYKVFKE